MVPSTMCAMRVMRLLFLVGLAPFLPMIIDFLRNLRQQQRATKALQNWVITDYHRPTRSDHISLLDCEEEASAAFEQMDPSAPAYLVLEANLSYTQAHGARSAEGVDGFLATKWLLQHLTWPSHDVTLVCWGSPHMELADGGYSRPKSGAQLARR